MGSEKHQPKYGALLPPAFMRGVSRRSPGRGESVGECGNFRTTPSLRASAHIGVVTEGNACGAIRFPLAFNHVSNRETPKGVGQLPV